MTRRARVAFLAGPLLAAAAAGWFHLREPAAGKPAGPAGSAPCPVTAGLVESAGAAPPAALVALGRRLFDDSRLSADGSVSCATCHQAARAFTDGRARAVGVGGRTGARNSPTLVNLAWAPVFGWDGRFPTMDQAIAAALTDPAEMGLTDAAVGRVLAADAAEFRRVLGVAPDVAAVARALAAYVATLHASGTRVDRFLYCGDESALTATERQGLELFAGRAHCVRCHVFEHERTTPLGGRLALFTDHRLHNLRAGRSPDSGAFKTPTLRDVALTAPYMHDGSLKTLAAVVNFYNRGGGGQPGLDPDVVPLGLRGPEQAALVAFLEALTTAPGAATAAGGR